MMPVVVMPPPLSIWLKVSARATLGSSCGIADAETIGNDIRPTITAPTMREELNFIMSSLWQISVDCFKR